MKYGTVVDGEVVTHRHTRMLPYHFKQYQHLRYLEVFHGMRARTEEIVTRNQMEVTAAAMNGIILLT